MVLVDTNVLLDVLQNDAQWGEWSQGELETASLTDSLAINAVIYSELSIAFERIEELEAVLSEASLSVADSARSTIPGGKGIPQLSAPPGNEARCFAGLLYRRTRGG